MADDGEPVRTPVPGLDPARPYQPWDPRWRWPALHAIAASTFAVIVTGVVGLVHGVDSYLAGELAVCVAMGAGCATFFVSYGRHHGKRWPACLATGAVVGAVALGYGFIHVLKDRRLTPDERVAPQRVVAYGQPWLEQSAMGYRLRHPGEEYERRELPNPPGWCWGRTEHGMLTLCHAVLQRDTPSGIAEHRAKFLEGFRSSSRDAGVEVRVTDELASGARGSFGDWRWRLVVHRTSDATGTRVLVVTVFMMAADPTAIDAIVDSFETMRR